MSNQGNLYFPMKVQPVDKNYIGILRYPDSGSSDTTLLTMSSGDGEVTAIYLDKDSNKFYFGAIYKPTS